MHLSLRRWAAVAGLLLFVLLCAVLAGSKYFPSSNTYWPVTTTADSGPGSLRAALAGAGDGDVIYFVSALNGQTIVISSGELAINSNVTIQGPGLDLLAVQPTSSSFRTFHVFPGHTVTIQALTIRPGGSVNGAGILNDHSTLELKNCAVRNGILPATANYGGGIYNDGSAGTATLTIIDCGILRNSARTAGGGIFNNGSSGGTATVSMWNSSIIENQASSPGVGTPPIGQGSGGGIYNDGSGARMTLTNCIVKNNSAGDSGFFPVGDGGGINNSGTLTIILSTIADNHAYSSGGGIFSSGTLAVLNSTVSGNRADGQHDGFQRGRGGGLFCGGTVTLTNSTLSNNYASNAGGGFNGSGTITHSTISGNAAGKDTAGILATGPVSIGNTILNAGAAGANISGAVTSLGYNLSSDDGGGFLTGPGDQINTDPLLGPLQDNAGPTFTHAPLNGSPAIDAGDPGFTPPPSEDQRGVPRVFNGRVDIGSVEVQPVSSPTPTPTPSPTPCGYILTFSESFDGVTAPALPPGWTSSFTAGAANCTPSGTCSLGMNWTTTSVAPYSQPHCAFHNAPGCVTDSFLDSPSFRAGPTNVAYLNFRHSFDLENGRDGAVLEISIEGGPFVDIAAIGGHPQYNGTIASDSLSPLAGRAAWTGNSGGYLATFLTFPQSAQGRNVRLRFRLATDCGGAGTGWRIDNVRVEDNIGCQPPSPTPPPPTSPTPSPTPAPTATPLPTPCGVTFSENFDGVTAIALPAGWTTSFSANATPWRTDTGFPASGRNSAYALGNGAVSRTELISPVIAAPPAGGILSFQNFFDLHAGLDGMVLDISVNGSAYVDFIAAGGSFLDGGYTHTIGNCCSSQIAGRMAWSGFAAGWPERPAYITSTIALPPAANGQNIQLKWRFVSDSYPTYGYVRIDSILLTPASCATSTPTPGPSPAQALNISTRLRVDTGSNIAIGGFIITGTGPRKVAIRALGPSLANFGLSDVLADPTLELRGSDGALLAQNDNWQDNSFQAAQLIALNLALPHPNESGIVAILEPGAYTALLAGKNQTSGVALVEVYDAEASATSQLSNISTRGFVRTGDNVMIGGFILGGSTQNTGIVVRGIGPSLAQFGLSGVLADPTLELRDSNGELVIASDNWQDDPGTAAQLTIRGLSPQHPLESGIFATLPPGAFTAVLAGKNAGIGIGLVEIYNVH